ncbi:nucleotide-binding oligomerization domain-containing protein 1 isoform X2 [Amia ocellicauda]|uniref:nucleotide-binding oligomerization domain-containing protein 1 isoform X2 n=1 Tax=Amia ocellicauda TaxID=2972642 RepID=UPI0034640946
MEVSGGVQKISYIPLLKQHRIFLIKTIPSTEWIVDSLVQHEFFTGEDKEMVEHSNTRSNKVRTLLDIVACKGEETAKCLLQTLHQGRHFYRELQPWFSTIQYQPSEGMLQKPVLLRDPASSYSMKLRQELGQSTAFIDTYVQREEMLLDEIYTESIMELLDKDNSILVCQRGFDDLFNNRAVINAEAEVTLITGDAGTGKTILLQKLQNLWVKGELLPDIKFFFMFKCRTLSCMENQPISLQDLLFRYGCCPERDADKVFDYILENPATVLLSFDGFDEVSSHVEVEVGPECLCASEPAQPLALLLSLMHGKLLRGSRKILTARTGTVIQKRTIRKNMVMKGFTQKNVLDYLKKVFKEEDQRRSMMNQLEANPSLSSLCSIPLFCWIIFKCFQNVKMAPISSQMPSSQMRLTDIFLRMVEVFLNRTSKASEVKVRGQVDVLVSGQKALVCLAKLAREYMLEGRYIFTQEALEAMDISDEDAAMGFLRPLGHYDGCGSQSTFEFLHLTLQSFLTALSLVIDKEVHCDQLVVFLRTGKIGEATSKCVPFKEKPAGGVSEHLQFTRLFLCGLLSEKRVGLLQTLTSTCLKKKQRKVLKYLKRSIQDDLKSQKKLWNPHSVPNFLWMLRCVFESQNKDLSELVAKGFRAENLKLTYCNLYSADCSVLMNVLQHIRTLSRLELDNNNITDYGVQELLPCFSSLEVLRLSVNQITDTGVHILTEELKKYKQIKFLGLYMNSISDVGAMDIASLIDSCPHFSVLKFGVNLITEKGGIALARAIQRSQSISEIGMWGNLIGDEGAAAFAEALRGHPSLIELSLSANGISSQGCKMLAEALCHNSCLKIFWLVENQLEDEAAESLAEMLKVNKTLESLCVKGNSFSKEEISLLEDKRIIPH